MSSGIPRTWSGLPVYDWMQCWFYERDARTKDLVLNLQRNLRKKDKKTPPKRKCPQPPNADHSRARRRARVGFRGNRNRERHLPPDAHFRRLRRPARASAQAATSAHVQYDGIQRQNVLLNLQHSLRNVLWDPEEEKICYLNVQKKIQLVIIDGLQLLQDLWSAEQAVFKESSLMLTAALDKLGDLKKCLSEMEHGMTSKEGQIAGMYGIIVVVVRLYFFCEVLTLTNFNNTFSTN